MLALPRLLLPLFLLCTLGQVSLGASCPGCEGTGGSDNKTAPGCGSISISVLMTSGSCLYVIEPGGGAIVCAMRQRCLASITRAWNGVQPNVAMDFCVLEGGQRRCVVPQPNSGTGTGSSLNSWGVSCGQQYTWEFTLPCPDVGSLTAAATGECSPASEGEHIALLLHQVGTQESPLLANEV